MSDPVSGVENMRTPGHIRDNEHVIPGTGLLIPGSCGNHVLNKRRNEYIVNVFILREKSENTTVLAFLKPQCLVWRFLY
jgi:hypothetical protein